MGPCTHRAAAPLLIAALAITVGGCDRAPVEAPSSPATPSPEPQPGAEREALYEPVEVVDEGPTAPVVLLTASLKGYTEPCGCTIDLLLGGLDRVVGYSLAARALAPDALSLDAGNLFFARPELEPIEREQELRKARVIAEAVRRIGVVATVPGPADLAEGLAHYRELIRDAGLAVVGSNLVAADGTELGVPYRLHTLGELTIGIIGAVDPALFESNTEVSASAAEDSANADAAAARAAGATTVILLFHGDLVSARRNLAGIVGVDFVVIGHEPRKTDSVTRIGSAYTLEAQDQGRTVGWLKLVAPSDAPVDAPADAQIGGWRNARAGSDDEVEQLRRVLSTSEEQLASLPAEVDGVEPEIVARLRSRIAGLRDELSRIDDGAPQFEPGVRTFLYRPVAIVPGFPADAPTTESMSTFNRSLREINLANAAPPLLPPDGHPSYVGAQVCATCHPAAHEFWSQTRHAGAIATLVERDKEYDRGCIGCHVTGYEQPGGSTLGHTDGLENVQCEQCHGPGSLHAADPTVRGAPLGVVLETSNETCVSCHNTEHSTRFDYETYRERIIGPGHGR